MSRYGCLLFILVTCDGVLSNEEQGFVQELDFSPIFDAGRADISGLASDPVAAAILKADNSLLPQIYDTAASGTLDSIQKRSARSNNVFSSEHFGFNPIASQGFRPIVQSAKLQAPPKQHQHSHHSLPIRQQARPLYDIRQFHDADYKVYKPEEEQGEEILAALKKNPSVSNYFQPGSTNVEVAHPVKYRREDQIENLESDYKPNHYIAGASRIRRYAGNKRQHPKKRSEEEEEDPYDYRADYVSRPKEFDSGHYSSAYKEEKDPNKDYEYPSEYDSGYDYKEYERIKELSEKQAAEIKQNPGNCKESKKDGMTCHVCKDPKTGGNYESCSYVQEPKNNKYAYSKEKKFDSNDEPDEPETKNESPKKLEKYQEAPEAEKASEEYVHEAPPEKRQAGYYKKDDDDGNDDSEDGKYKAYYTHQSKPTPSESLRAAEESASSEDSSDSVIKPYNYKDAIPELYTNNEPKKDVEHVLAEFRKKDRSSCKKVYKNGMTCFQCIDKNGLKNEECMFVSESAPKQSHLAYQEVKEFTSRPPTLDGDESQLVTTSAPAPQRSAAYIVANGGYGKKLKRKKAPQVAQAAVPNLSPTLAALTRKVKRNAEEEEADERAAIVDETNVAPPEEFAGDNSKGAYWSETMPRYSAALGVTLPEYMLARSEHEASFDEAVAGA